MMNLFINNLLIIDCMTQSKINTFYLLGLGVFVLRIAVPVVLLIFGIIDLIKVVTSGSDKEMMPVVKRLGIKFVLAAIVFLLPTFISILLNLTHTTSDKDDIEGICVLHATSSQCTNRVNFNYISDPEVCYSQGSGSGSGSGSGGSSENTPIQPTQDYHWQVPVKIKDCSKLVDYWAEITIFDDGEKTYETDTSTEDTVRYDGSSSSCKNYEIGKLDTNVSFSNVTQELEFDNSMYIQFELDPSVYDKETGEIRQKTFTISDMSGNNFKLINFPSGVTISFNSSEYKDFKIEIKYHKN